MRRAESLQCLPIGRRQRIEHPEHEHGVHARAGLNDRHLDLRQALAGIHRADQRAQRHQQGSDRPGQHMALADVGHEAAGAFVEPDQRFGLARDVAHRQPRPVPVVPLDPCDRAHDLLGLQTSQVPQRVFQHALLHGDLGPRVQMLHRTAATCAAP